MNVLIACEESQTVCKAFRELGFNAYSCDIVECSGEHPEWHFQSDVFDVIKRKGGVTQRGNLVFGDKWDHPVVQNSIITQTTKIYRLNNVDRIHGFHIGNKTKMQPLISLWLYTIQTFRILPLRILLVLCLRDSVSQTRLYNRICLATQHVRPLVCGLRVCHLWNLLRWYPRVNPLYSVVERKCLNGIAMH